MANLGEVKAHATRLYAQSHPLHALRLYDAIVQSAPLDFDARLKAADCLVPLGEAEHAVKVYRAVGWYALKAGHPLLTIVIARVLETLNAEKADLEAALVVRYGSESELIGKMAARLHLPAATTQVSPPDLRTAPVDRFISEASARAATCTDSFDEFPPTLHPIPLLSTLSEEAFRRVLGTLQVLRLPDGAHVIREGEPGQSFYFLAGGNVRVYAIDALGRQTELAKLGEGAVFGEMALISAQPRSASVQVVGEADLLEVTRDSMSALADELEPVAVALHQFTRQRLLNNLMATNRLFKPFDRPQQRDLLRRFTSHDVAPGTDIIHQGDEGLGLFVVLSGEMEVIREEDGKTTALATLRSGDVFGEMALIRSDRTTATVRAAKQGTVLFLARDYVTRLVAIAPDLKKYLEALADDRQMATELLSAAGDVVPDDEIIFI